MVGAAILIPIATNFIACLIAMAVAWRMATHPPHGDAGRAVRRFVAWWLALAGYIFLNQVDAVLTIANADPVPVHAALTYAAITLLGVALWGLVSYVVYLYAGRATVFPVVTVLYVVQMIVVLAWLASLSPTRLAVTDRGLVPEYADPPTALGGSLFALFFLLPPLAGSLALGALFFRVRDPTTRYRLAAISVGIFVWFSVAVVIGGSGDTSLLSSVGGPLLATLCMLLIATAYFPPRWLRARGVKPFGASPETTPPAPPGAPSRTEKARSASLV